MADADNRFQSRAQQDLFADLLARVRRLEIDNGSTSAWAPQIVGSSVSPTYTLGAIQGAFLRRRDWVFANFQMVLSGWSSGSGSYAIRTPWPPNIHPTGARQVTGQWWANHGTSTYAGTLTSVGIGTPNPNPDHWLAAVGSSTAIASPIYPWAWASGDVLTGTLSYQVTPGY